ncbi:DUF2933 domain-containing protein [Paenibacillus anaericanus]|uniref:DUF2933 domain-containing protein n=1 Tax=Paenibacillus anaericanus TaxID=170367 RepID=A0A3S1EH17_9BACL|nr:DUF2933 domain-containing protein [Paenibacillus anaericanus]RUT45565.1 DUF2933 domain-containing protein [Paenibacillus anaericanus]
MDWSWLFVLACPLMMIVMMFGMRGMHGHGSKSKQSETEQANQEELSALKAQNELMKEEIQKLKQ